ncbi:MAG: hypothetical protein ACI9BW_002304 [Gammaproteobacteria bacterium]|jgi:hypothetical protein
MTPEPFIPTSRRELIESLSGSDRLSPVDQLEFKKFCEILSAYSHFAGQKNLELMKSAFAEFDPNDDGPKEQLASAQTRSESAGILIEAFDRTLKRANFQHLPEQAIREALNKASIIPVQTAVEFDDFEKFAFYFRTSNVIETKVKKWFKTKSIEVDNYDRMAVFLQVKEEALVDQASEAHERDLIPGKIYLNLYKNVPHYDLELLFPNLKISMNLKDKLMLAIPAVGAAVPLALKVLPSIGLLVGAIAIVVFGLELGGRFVIEDTDQKAVYALFTAVLSISLALGGFAARQLLKYKSRRLEFLKKVADVLFFKTLDVGKGVLNALVDSAEEEECKEMILVFYILVLSEHPMTVQNVDMACESWLSERYDINVNFDTKKALQSLAAIRNPDSDEDVSIVFRSDDGRYSAVDIEQAKRLIDCVWDNAFKY